MNRRLFLAMTLAVGSASVLELTGCGSGHSGGGEGGIRFVSRRVVTQLPTGFSVSLTDIVAEAGKKGVALDASGVFTVQTPDTDIPSLAMLRDKSGRGVLMGFLPAAEGGTLTTRSAAVALLYYALGGFMLPEASRRPLVTLLEADPTTVTLGAVISRRMIANPYVLEADDAEINAALKIAFDTLTVSRAVRAQSFSESFSESFTAAVRRTRATGTPLLQVQPGGLQSNVEVLQADNGANGAAIIATNHSRRYCKVYVYQVGTPEALPKALLQGEPIPLNSTNSLGVFSTLNNLISGQTAYVPVSTRSIFLPLASGSKKTLYEVIVVGASENDLPRGFYSEPRYADEQAKWVQAREDLSQLTWWQNLILPVFFEALGIAGLSATTVAVEGSLAAIKAIEEQSVKTLLFNAGKGRFVVAMKDLWALAGESTAVGAKVREALTPLYEVAVGQLAAETAAARMALFARLIARAAVAAVVLLGTGDIAAVLHDTTLAQPAEQWTAVVFEPSLILDPTAKTIAPGQRVTFSVHPPAGTTGTISYTWTTDAINATLSSSDGVVGNPITTTSTSVDLVTTPSTQGKVTVTVVATLTDAGGHASELGTAQAVVTLNATTTFADVKFAIASSPISTGPDAGKKFLHAMYTFSVPKEGWSQVQVFSKGGNPQADYNFSESTRLDRDVYDRGAPVSGDGADWSQWIGYGGLRGSLWVNLGDGKMGYRFLGTNPISSPEEEQWNRDAFQVDIDRRMARLPKAVFS
jgi:hypothetical protein